MRFEIINKNATAASGGVRCYFLTLLPMIEIIYCPEHSNTYTRYSSQLIVYFEWLSFSMRLVLKELKTYRTERKSTKINKIQPTNKNEHENTEN